MQIKKCVIERLYRFRLYTPAGAPTQHIAAVRAESEAAARLKLPQNSEGTRDWRLIEAKYPEEKEP